MRCGAGARTGDRKPCSERAAFNGGRAGIGAPARYHRRHVDRAFAVDGDARRNRAVCELGAGRGRGGHPGRVAGRGRAARVPGGVRGVHGDLLRDGVARANAAASRVPDRRRGHAAAGRERVPRARRLRVPDDVLRAADARPATRVRAAPGPAGPWRAVQRGRLERLHALAFRARRAARCTRCRTGPRSRRSSCSPISSPPRSTPSSRPPARSRSSSSRTAWAASWCARICAGSAGRRCAA